MSKKSKTTKWLIFRMLSSDYLTNICVFISRGSFKSKTSPTVSHSKNVNYSQISICLKTFSFFKIWHHHSVRHFIHNFYVLLYIQYTPRYTRHELSTTDDHTKKVIVILIGTVFKKNFFLKDSVVWSLPQNTACRIVIQI